MNIFKYLWQNIQNLAGHPINRAVEEVKRAAQGHARAVAEVKYQEKMRSFYSNQASLLDPYTRWWEFAAAKDSEQTHTEDLSFEERREKQALAKLQACQARLTELRREFD